MNLSKVNEKISRGINLILLEKKIPFPFLIDIIPFEVSLFVSENLCVCGYRMAATQKKSLGQSQTHDIENSNNGDGMKSISVKLLYKRLHG